ncbi:MAG: DUF5677 domain-containing protein [Phycisphaerae bacterium]|jgi:hypothetical protein
MDKDIHLAVLHDTIKLARQIVRKCTKEKHLKEDRLWVVSLLAKAASTSEAVHTLASHGLAVETKILSRSIYDALIDIYYIRSDPGRTRERWDLYCLEYAEDRYEHLKFLARMHETHVKGIVKIYPSLREVAEEYARVKRDPAFKKRSKGDRQWFPERWRWISAAKKLKGLADFIKRDFDRIMGFSVRKLGDAHAHHRPVALRLLWYPKGRSEAGVRSRPRSDEFFYSAEFVAFEVCLLMIAMCDQVADKFFLLPGFEKRLKKLVDRLRALPRIHGLVAKERRKHKLMI